MKYELVKAIYDTGIFRSFKSKIKVYFFQKHNFFYLGDSVVIGCQIFV